MTFSELLPRLVSSLDEFSAYTLTLPEWVQLWMLFMVAIFLPVFIFMIWHKEARVMAAALVSDHILGLFTMVAAGPTMQWLGHVLYWPVAVAYVVLRYKQINWRSLYGVWLGVATASMVFSLIFDIRDFVIFFAS